MLLPHGQQASNFMMISLSMPIEGISSSVESLFLLRSYQAFNLLKGERCSVEGAGELKKGEKMRVKIRLELLKTTIIVSRFYYQLMRVNRSRQEQLAIKSKSRTSSPCSKEPSVNLASLSTGTRIPQRQLVNQTSISIHTQISMHQEVADLDGKLDHVYNLHKRSSQTINIDKIEVDFQSSHKKRHSEILQDRCREIIEIPLKAKIKKRRLKKNIFKTQPDLNPDEEVEIAQQLIMESRRERKQFGQVLKQFRHRIQDAGISFAKRQGINVVQFKKAGGLKEVLRKMRVCNDFSQEKEESESYRLARKQNMYDLNKEDVYSSVKNTYKFINLHELRSKSISSTEKKTERSAGKVRPHSLQGQDLQTFKKNLKSSLVKNSPLRLKTPQKVRF